MVIVNALVSIALIPLLLVLKGPFLYLSVAVVALVVGLIFNFLIMDIEHLDRKHHLFAAAFIPLMAVINIFLITSFSNRVDKLLKLNVSQDPITISAVYVVVFIMPYLVSIARRR